uniref:Uncharacterized protein n=1 Tax=Ditylenchus dipsaci TaxID=166011 RepID=A0A915CR09_9BILA
MKALCWIKSMYKTERNLPLTITSDIVFSSICKRFHTIVKTSFKKHPIRVIYAVLVEKPVDQEGGSIMNPTIIIYSKDSLLKREFKSLEDVLALKQKQNVAFLNISIYHEDVDIEEVKYPMENDSLIQSSLAIPAYLAGIQHETTNSATLKLYKTNYYRFVEPLDVLVDIIFQSFQSQNKPCQYEIVVTDLQEINVSACKINKTARNYVTNEVMESIFLKI